MIRSAQNTNSPGKLFKIVSIIIFTFFSFSVKAQEPPPRPIEVSTASGISFGAFTHTTGGTIIIDAAAVDSRIPGGSIILLGMGYPVHRARFIIKGNVGTIINLSYNPVASLGTLSMTIDSTYPVSPFPLANQYPADNILYIGGTLTVGAGSAAGTYNGTFTIDFIQNWE